MLAGLILALPIAGCGKKGAPLPPIRREPEQVSRLEARQIGDRLYLSFPRPRSRTDDTRIGPDATVEVVMSDRDPAPRRAHEIVADPTAAWIVPASDWDAYAEGDRLEVGIGIDRIARVIGGAARSGPMEGRRLVFAVVVTEPKNQRSAASEIAEVTICSPPPPPSEGIARITESGILVSWAGGGTMRQNLYRRERGGPRPARPIHPAPLAATTYLDETAAEGRPYIYVVRTAGASAGCESADSAPVPATRIDLFPPAPPQGLAAVTEGDAIRLFWRPNREPDLQGYRVYRAEGPGTPWTLLTPGGTTATSHTDEDVVAGVSYVYAVTAVDLAEQPNESGFSEMTVETVEADE